MAQSPEEIAALKQQQEQQKALHASMLNECLEIILTGYTPAGIDTADDYISTDAIINSIFSHTGSIYMREEIYETMKQKGYQSGGQELRWMLQSNR